MTFKESLAADLSNVFFNTAEFAEEVTWTPLTGTAQTIAVLWDDPYRAANPVSGQVEDTAPQCLAPTANIGGMTQGDMITRQGTDYYVIEMQPDGSGITTVVLSKDTLHG